MGVGSSDINIGWSDFADLDGVRIFDVGRRHDLAIVGHDIGKWVKIGTQKEVPVRCFEHVHQARDLYKSWTTTKNHITNVYLGISLGVTISS
jgi:hypothetical protein